MRLSAYGEYACLAMVDLSQNYGKGPLKIKDIAEREQIPQKFLEQILLTLKRAGYLQSKRGFHGGYELSRAPKQITVAEIVRFTDGAVAPVASVSSHFYAHSPSEKNAALTGLFKEVRDMVSTKLEGTTFADLII